MDRKCDFIPFNNLIGVWLPMFIVELLLLCQKIDSEVAVKPLAIIFLFMYSEATFLFIYKLVNI